MLSEIISELKSQKMIKNFVFVLLIVQPILDIISFFVAESNLNIFTTLLRMLIFGVVALYGFLITENKKPYFIMAAVLVVFFICHMVACFSDGYISLYEDVTMYVRTIQVPVYALAFITFFKHADSLKEEVGKAFWINYITITISILISFAVGRPEFTYTSGNGIKGWFYTGNAQSCIISVMAPLGLCYAYRKKNNWLFFFTLLLEFANLYFFGTRVAYYSIFIVGVAFLFFMVWNKEKRWAAYFMVITAMVVCMAGYKISPCYLQQYEANASYDEWTEEIDKIKEDNKEQDNQEQEINIEDYREIYELYCEKLVERFGLRKVVEKYEYSTETADIISNRALKVNFGHLMMEEKNLLTHLFGFEYSDYLYDGEIFEPENDFPGIYFSCGYVGLGLYIAFIGYFVVVALKGVIVDKWKISLEKGMLGTALVLMVATAQMSGNVLRRPNVSIYLSIMLAYLYVISVTKKKGNEDAKE